MKNINTISVWILLLTIGTAVAQTQNGSTQNGSKTGTDQLRVKSLNVLNSVDQEVKASQDEIKKLSGGKELGTYPTQADPCAAQDLFIRDLYDQFIIENHDIIESLFVELRANLNQSWSVLDEFSSDEAWRPRFHAILAYEQAVQKGLNPVVPADLTKEVLALNEELIRRNSPVRLQLSQGNQDHATRVEVRLMVKPKPEWKGLVRSATLAEKTGENRGKIPVNLNLAELMVSSITDDQIWKIVSQNQLSIHSTPIDGMKRWEWAESFRSAECDERFKKKTSNETHSSPYVSYSKLVNESSAKANQNSNPKTAKKVPCDPNGGMSIVKVSVSGFQGMKRVSVDVTEKYLDLNGKKEFNRKIERSEIPASMLNQFDHYWLEFDYICGCNGAVQHFKQVIKPDGYLGRFGC